MSLSENRKQVLDMYKDWLKNWKYIEDFALHYGINRLYAEDILRCGAKLYNK